MTRQTQDEEAWANVDGAIALLETIGEEGAMGGADCMAWGHYGRYAAALRKLKEAKRLHEAHERSEAISVPDNPRMISLDTLDTREGLLVGKAQDGTLIMLVSPMATKLKPQDWVFPDAPEEEKQ